MHNPANKKKGFTLIEILVSLVVLTGASIVISRIWTGNRERVTKIDDYHKIVQLMENKISELEFEWRKKNFNSIPREEKGDFKEEKHFSWSVRTQPLKLPEPKQMLSLFGQSQSQGQGASLQVAKVTTDFLSQAVLEAKLTIHYKKGNLKSAYSITTYIVDHTKSISIPGGAP